MCFQVDIGMQTDDESISLEAVAAKPLTPLSVQSNPETPSSVLTPAPIPFLSQISNSLQSNVKTQPTIQQQQPSIQQQQQPSILIQGQTITSLNNNSNKNNNNNNTVKLNLTGQSMDANVASPIIIPINQKGCRIAVQNGQLVLINDNNPQTTTIAQLPLQQQQQLLQTHTGQQITLQPNMAGASLLPSQAKPITSLQSIQPSPGGSITLGNGNNTNNNNNNNGCMVLKNNAVTTPLYCEESGGGGVGKSAQSIRISTPNGPLMMNTRRQQPNQMPAALVLPSGQIIPVVTRPGAIVTHPSAPRNITSSGGVAKTVVSSSASKQLPNTLSAMINNEGNIILTMPANVVKKHNAGSGHLPTKEQILDKFTNDLLAQATESIFSSSPHAGLLTNTTSTSTSLAAAVTTTGSADYRSSVNDDDDNPLQIVVEPPGGDERPPLEESDISDFSDLIRIPTGNTPHKAKRKVTAEPSSPMPSSHSSCSTTSSPLSTTSTIAAAPHRVQMKPPSPGPSFTTTDATGVTMETKPDELVRCILLLILKYIRLPL